MASDDRNPWWMSASGANRLARPIGALRQMAGGAVGLRRIWRRMPSGARCKQCYVPFMGPLCLPFRLIQLRPSRKNPNLCTV